MQIISINIGSFVESGNVAARGHPFRVRLHSLNFAFGCTGREKLHLQTQHARPFPRPWPSRPPTGPSTPSALVPTPSHVSIGPLLGRGGSPAPLAAGKTAAGAHFNQTVLGRTVRSGADSLVVGPLSGRRCLPPSTPREATCLWSCWRRRNGRPRPNDRREPSFCL